MQVVASVRPLRYCEYLFMKYRSARFVALLWVVASVTIAAVEVWPAARAVRTSDRNGDGRPDVWRLYDNRGQLTEVDVDSNFDGAPDIAEYYERGALVRRESDRNFNGQIDLVEEFDVETHGQTRAVFDTDYDGTADLLVLFRDGRPVFSKRAGSLSRSSATHPTAPAAHGATTLNQMTDPFDADTAIRPAHLASADKGCVGLSTSGGLPRPHVAALGSRTLTARLVARDVQPTAPTLLLHRSPRAPPAS